MQGIIYELCFNLSMIKAKIYDVVMKSFSLNIFWMVKVLAVKEKKQTTSIVKDTLSFNVG
jgi:hypothetical protein